MSEVPLQGAFCRSQLPHRFVNIPFTITNMKNKLPDLWGLTSAQ